MLKQTVLRDNRRGRHSGSYDLELTANMQQLLGIKGGILYMHTEGSWSKSGGIDSPSVTGKLSALSEMAKVIIWLEQEVFPLRKIANLADQTLEKTSIVSLNYNLESIVK